MEGTIMVGPVWPESSGPEVIPMWVVGVCVHGLPQDKEGMSWVVMDMTDLSFPDGR